MQVVVVPVRAQVVQPGIAAEQAVQFLVAVL